MKNTLIPTPIMVFPDFKKNFANFDKIEAVLWLEDNQGYELVIEYDSHMNSHEKGHC